MNKHKQLLEAILNASLDGILALSESTETPLATAAFSSLFAGWEKLRYNEPLEVVHNFYSKYVADVDTLLNLVTKVRRTRELHEGKIHLLDGRIMRLIGRVIKTQDGSEIEVWNHRDITEQCRQDEQLQLRLQLITAILNASTDAIFTVVEGMEKPLANAKYSSIFPGWEKALRYGQPLQEVQDFFAQYLVNWETQVGLIAKVRQTKQYHQTIIYHKDGRIFDISGKMVNVEFIRHGALEIYTLKDITEEVRNRQKMQAMQLTVDNLSEPVVWLDVRGKITYANQAACAALGYDEPAEMTGKTVWHFYGTQQYGDGVSDAWGTTLETLRKDTHIKFDHTTLAKRDGTRLPCTILIDYITEGSEPFLAVCFHDLSEQIQRVEAERAATAKSEFLARMSHEIRTPLNSVLGIAEIVSQMDIPDKAREYLCILAMSGKSLLAIINDILDFSKLELGSMKIESSEYSFTSLLHVTINIIQILIIRKPQLDFVVRVDPTIPERLIGDEVRIRQILFNLLSNAIKYTTSGYISLNIQHEKSVNSTSLIISVEDTGIGIDEENFTNIFDAFTRVNEKQYANIEGTGLGLAITKTLCAMMGGDLSVKSARQSGSCFTAVIPQEYVGEEIAAKVMNPSSARALLYIENPMQLESLLWAFEDMGLPEPCVVKDCKGLSGALLRGNYDYAIVFPKVVRACLPVLKGTPTKLIVLTRFNESTGLDRVENLVSPVNSVTLAGMLNGGRPESGASRFRRRYAFPAARILVVDDIPANLLVVKELLARYGAKTDTAINGVDAVEIVKKYPYDIVFMDHMMPGMDGVAATIAIRAEGENIPRCRDVPVIALTANAMSGHREIFLQCGMNDFLAKPIEVEKLDKILVKYLPVEKRVEIVDRQEDAVPPADIEGVDTRTGLRNVGGSADAYRDILREFCRDVQIKIVELEEALNNERLKDYTILAHSIKGTAGVIGAGHVVGLAAALEEAATKEDWDFLRVGTEPFLGVLRDVLSKIRGALHAQIPPSVRAENPPADIDSFKLDVMRNALSNIDIQTANNLLSEYMAMDINDEQRRKISELDRLITSFEFDDAIEIIDAWKNEAPLQ